MAAEQYKTRKQSYCRGRRQLNNKTLEKKVIVGAGAVEAHLLETSNPDFTVETLKMRTYLQSNLPMRSPLINSPLNLKVTLFISCHRKLNMN